MRLSALPTMTLSDMIMPSKRRNMEDDEITFIPERSAQYIFEGKQQASGNLDAQDKSGYPDLSDLSGLIL